MSGTLSNENSDGNVESRGRIRRCKHCKFSCTDAKEFFTHQIMEHAESSEPSFVTPAATVHELPKLTPIIKQEPVSIPEEQQIPYTEPPQEETNEKPTNSDTIVINNIVPEEDDDNEDGRLVIADQNEDGNNSESVVTPTRSGNIQNRTYVCSGCDFSTTSAKVFLNHQKDTHKFDIIIYECDICEYATKYKQKLPRHRKLHFSGQDNLLGDSMDEFGNGEFPNDFNDDDLPEDSFKDLPPLIDSNTVIVTPTDPDEPIPEKKPKKRQEVDPAKYFEVVDDAGCKYACSSCGNVYKWRKSLNKHWKEKHGGELPDNSRKPPGLVYLVNSGGHTICGRRKILANSSMNKSHNGSLMDTSTNSSTPGTPLSAAAAEIMMSMSELTRSSVSPASSVIPSFIGPFVTNSLSQPVFPETSTPNHRHASKPKPHFNKIRIQGQSEPLDFSVKKDDEVAMQSSYMDVKPEPAWANSTEDQSKEEDKDKSVLQCTKCSFVAKTLVDYSSHMTVHLNKRAFKCAECNDHFNGVDDLNLHFAEVHANRIQEHKEALQRIPHGLQQTYHLLKMPLNAITSLNSQDLTPSNDNKKLKCNMCSFVAKWPAELQKHAVSHSEERPFMCMVCGSTYKWKWDLVKHFEKSHHSLPNPYKRRDINSNKNGASPSMVKGASLLTDEESGLLGEPSTKRPRLSDSGLEGFDRLDDESKNSLSHLTDLNIDVNGLANIGRSMGLAGNGPLPLPKLSDMDPEDVMDEDVKQFERELQHGKRPINEMTQKAIAAAVLNRLNNPSQKGEPPINLNDDSSVLLPYKCQRCEYRARWPSEITQHMKNHSEDKPYLCPRCSYRSKWKWDVVKHLKRCGGGGTIRDVIDTTKSRKSAPPNVMVMPEGSLHQQTPQPNNFSLHNSSLESAALAKMALEKSEFLKSGGSKKPFFRSLINDGLYHCLECQFVGTSPAELKRHSVLHSENKPFMCEICGYSSRWKCDLKKHMRTYNHYTSAAQMLESQSGDQTNSENEDGENVYKCSKCYFSTDQLYLYKEHLLVHDSSKSSNNGGSAGRFKCKQCPFQVNDLASFLQHRVTHTGSSGQSSPVPVQISPVESPKTDMDEARIRHPRKQVKTFKCSRCDFVCKRRDLLEAHELEHNDADSIYKCVYCESSFRDKDTLLDHITSHSDFNPDEWETFFMEEEAEENNNEPMESLQQIKKPESVSVGDNPRLASALASGPQYKTHNEDKTHPQKMPGGIIAPAARKFTCEWCDATFAHVSTLYHHGKNVHPIELSAQEMAESARDFMVAGLDGKANAEDLKKASSFYSAAISSGNHFLINPALMTSQVLSQVAAAGKDRPILPNNMNPLLQRKSISPQQKRSKSFQCTKCPFTAPNAVTYLRHIERHGSNCKHTCWFCDYSIDRLNLLYQHMKGTHTEQWRKTAMTGDISPKPDLKENSPSYNSYDDSNNSDTGTNSKLVIKEEILLKGVPVQICTYDGKRVFKCKKCSYMSSNAANTTNHAREHAEQMNLEDNTETVQAMNNLVKALRAQKEKKKTMPNHHRCSKCPFKSYSDEDFDKHRACHGYNGMYRCEQCDFSTDKVMILTQHMQLHENNQPVKDTKSFIPINSTYNRIVLNRRPGKGKDSASKLLSIQAKTSLNKSKRIRYKCSRCPYNSFCKNNMIKHRRQHIVKSRFKCPICNYSASRDYLLFQHMKFHGGDADKLIAQMKEKQNSEDMEMSEEDKLDFTNIKTNSTDGLLLCQGCPYSSNSEAEYQKHIKMHFTESTYKCDYCSLNSESLPKLLEHRLLHAEEDYFNDNPPMASLLNKSSTNDVSSTSYQNHDSPLPSKGDAFGEKMSPRPQEELLKSLDKSELGEKVSDSPSKKRQKCSKCPYHTQSQQLLVNHMKMHATGQLSDCNGVDQLPLMQQQAKVHNSSNKSPHASNVQVIEPGTSKITFPQLYFSSNTEEKVTEETLEEFKCDRCPYSTNVETDLDSHEHGHNFKSSLSCPYCDFSSAVETQILDHIQLHLPGTSKEAVKVILDRRQKELNNNINADDKMNAKEPSTTKVDNEPDSTVSEGQKCQESTEQTENSKTDVETDDEASKSTTKVYVCQYCEREFDKKSNMISHERQHMIGQS